VRTFACLGPIALLTVVFAACGGDDASTNVTGDGGAGTGSDSSATDAATSNGDGSTHVDGGSESDGSSLHDSAGGNDASSGDAAGCGTCPTGYSCGTANGISVCRAASGIPLFSNVYLILMENTSLSTLSPALMNGTAPNLEMLATTYATGSNYHGVSHPSLPNYIALTSGSTQGIACDCQAAPNGSTCNGATCNALLGACSCAQSAASIADQLEAANLTWMAFGEDMGTPCNTTDSGNYAQRHVPFLYYSGIQGNSARCDAHVVDFSMFSAASPSAFNFIAPNLIDDMHNPDPTNATNIPDGDMWIGPHVQAITSSAAYAQGGLLVVVWDEDDNSGFPTADAPIPIFVISPYAKHGGYVSATMANHYSLLATVEDGLGLTRLGMAAAATPLSDYFPAN
jgi:hypothetical protein